MPPAVSVITAAHDAEATLAAAIGSVRAQTDPDWEMLIVDDASTDGTKELAAAWAARDPRIGVIARAENGGAAAARNEGIRAARGRFIAFLDADDRWRPEKLARQRAFMDARGAALSFTAYRREDGAGRDLGLVRVPAAVDYATLLKGNVIGCLTAVYDTRHFGKVEMPPLRKRQDYGLWLKLLRAGGVAHGLDEVLADYRVAPRSLSGNKLAAARGTWRLYREAEGLPLPRAAWCLAQNLAHGLRKRGL